MHYPPALGIYLSIKYAPAKGHEIGGSDAWDESVEWESKNSDVVAHNFRPKKEIIKSSRTQQNLKRIIKIVDINGVIFNLSE